MARQSVAKNIPRTGEKLADAGVWRLTGLCYLRFLFMGGS
jgi:hypothetical protein